MVVVEESLVVVGLAVVGVVSAVAAAKVGGVVARLGFFDLQRHPHHQYPCCRFPQIAFGLWVDLDMM
jgi:hypothetical protein